MKNAWYSRRCWGTYLAVVLVVSCTPYDAAEKASTAANIDREVSLDTILQMNLRVVRGEIDAVVIESTDKTLRISEEDYSLIGRYRASADGAMRIDVFADDQRVYSEGKDDSGVWEWPGGQDGPVDVHHDGTGALEHGVEFNLFPLAEFGSRGHEVELVDSEAIRGAEYFVLKITLNDGFETYRYVNRESWLVEISRDFRAFHPGVDATRKEIETRYDQWIRTEGVLYPGRSRNFDRTSGELLGTTLVLESKYNVPRASLDLERSYVPDGAPMQE